VFIPQTQHFRLDPDREAGFVNADGRRALSQNDDIRDHFRSGVSFERIAWQPHCRKQLGLLREVAANHALFFIERIARSDEGKNPARFKQGQAFDEEVIVNAFAQTFVFERRIVNRVVSFCGVTGV
jgi:hypothetical protein